MAEKGLVVLILLGFLYIITAFIRIANIIIDLYVVNREDNSLSSLWSEKNFPNFNTDQGPIAVSYHNTCYNKDMDTRLNDFYICSAFRPYQVAGHSYDICSLKSIKLTLDKGARFHYLDIWSSNPENNLDDNAYPIVRNETLMPKYGKALLFEDVCSIYKDHSWLDNNYPLLLYLNIHPCSNGKVNKFMLRRMADILWKAFKGRFAPSKYSFGNTNIGEMTMKEAMGTVTILTNIYPDDAYMQEITHGVISEKAHNSGTLLIYGKAHQRYGGTQALSSNMDSVIARNRTHLGLVIPDERIALTNLVEPTTDITNIDFKDPMKFGYGAIFMNFQKPGKSRDDYIEFFKKRSFVLKDDGLRDIPCPDPDVLEQNPKASYAPREVNVYDGYFKHNF